MATYLAYYRVAPSFNEENQARARGGGSGIDPKFRQMVVDLPNRLPSSCRILGSYAPVGGGAVLSEPGAPAVMIIETSDPRDLTFISQYYTGYLIFQWTPATSVGGNRQERESWAATTAAPAAARP